MAKQPKWTKEEDEILEQNYGKLTAKKIFEKNLLPGRTWEGIRSRAKAKKWKSNLRELTHTFDEHFWDVPNPINAYWAGVMAADGSIIHRRDRNITKILQLTISVADIDHLQKFKEATKYSGPIRHYMSKCKISKTPEKDHEMVYVRICQMWKCEQVLREIWGIVPLKTHRVAPPAVSNRVLQLCYMIGYIDGDGTITANYSRKNAFLSIVSSSKSIIDWFGEITKEHFPCTARNLKTKRSLVFDRKDGCKMFSVGSFRMAKMLTILRKIPVPRMPRKWDNPEILEMAKRFEIEYPEKWAERLPIEDEIDAYFLQNPPVPA